MHPDCFICSGNLTLLRQQELIHTFQIQSPLTRRCGLTVYFHEFRPGHIFSMHLNLEFDGTHRDYLIRQEVYCYDIEEELSIFDPRCRSVLGCAQDEIVTGPVEFERSVQQGHHIVFGGIHGLLGGVFKITPVPVAHMVLHWGR